MSDNYDDGFDFDEDFDPEEEDLGLLKFSELRDICEQHIENGNPAYNEEEFLKIVRWLEETKINNILLGLILDGKIDIIFDPEKIAEANVDEKDGLLFTMSNSARAEMEELGLFQEDEEEETSSFFNLKFDDKEEDV